MIKAGPDSYNEILNVFGTEIQWKDFQRNGVLQPAVAAVFAKQAVWFLDQFRNHIGGGPGVAIDAQFSPPNRERYTKASEGIWVDGDNVVCFTIRIDLASGTLRGAARATVETKIRTIQPPPRYPHPPRARFGYVDPASCAWFEETYRIAGDERRMKLVWVEQESGMTPEHLKSNTDALSVLFDELVERLRSDARDQAWIVSTEPRAV